MAKKKRKKRKKRSYAAGSAFHPFEKLRDSFRYKRSLYVITGIIMFAVLVVAAAVLYVADNYTVKNIEVDGNTLAPMQEYDDEFIYFDDLRSYTPTQGKIYRGRS